MPRKAKDYSKALVYKLCCLDPNVKEVYVGSTTNFTKRKAQHKHSCNNETSKGYNLKVYQHIRAFGGWDNWEMVLIEYFPCETELELGRREDYWKQELQASLNSIPPHIYETRHEQYENNKEHAAEYRQANKEKIAKQHKEYYEANKEKILERMKQKITCECGSTIRRDGLEEHKQSKKHQNHLAENTDK